jgi:hypothetical protein
LIFYYQDSAYSGLLLIAMFLLVAFNFVLVLWSAPVAENKTDANKLNSVFYFRVLVKLHIILTVSLRSFVVKAGFSGKAITQQARLAI